LVPLRLRLICEKLSLIAMDDLGLALDLHHSSEQMETRRAEQFMRHRRRKSAFLTEPDRPKPVVGETAFLFAEFVSMREHAPLEELRLELLEMVEEVKKKQVDVISVEYAEFVGIADGLKGLDRELEDLGPSLLEMQRDVQDMLAAAQVSVQEMQQSIHVEQLGLAAQVSLCEVTEGGRFSSNRITSWRTLSTPSTSLSKTSNLTRNWRCIASSNSSTRARPLLHWVWTPHCTRHAPILSSQCVEVPSFAQSAYTVNSSFDVFGQFGQCVPNALSHACSDDALDGLAECGIGHRGTNGCNNGLVALLGMVHVHHVL
jgi:hypothetical protein